MAQLQNTSGAQLNIVNLHLGYFYVWVIFVFQLLPKVQGFSPVPV